MSSACVRVTFTEDAGTTLEPKNAIRVTMPVCSPLGTGTNCASVADAYDGPLSFGIQDPDGSRISPASRVKLTARKMRSEEFEHFKVSGSRCGVNASYVRLAN